MPTAVQEVAEAQDTPFRAFPVEPDGLGVLWISQDGLAAGKSAANPARVAAPAVPASARTYPMVKVTVTTTAKRLVLARPPLRDLIIKGIFPPTLVHMECKPGLFGRLVWK